MTTPTELIRAVERLRTDTQRLANVIAQARQDATPRQGGDLLLEAADLARQLHAELGYIVAAYDDGLDAMAEDLMAGRDPFPPPPQSKAAAGACAAVGPAGMTGPGVHPVFADMLARAFAPVATRNGDIY